MNEPARDMAELRPRIVVIGVGGAGGNAVASMIRNEVTGVEFVVVNTDAQALQASPAQRVIQLGAKTTQGLGAGSSAGLGKAAAEESLAEINAVLDGAHMCFIAAGLGGGTGTGAAPIIAQAARAKGILTLAVVSKPFGFEGARRARAADAGLLDLEAHVDTLIVIPNQNLFRVANPDTTFKAAFDLADEVLQQGVRGITDLMVMPGLINLDFADIRSIMGNRGKAMLGTGEATGEDRAIRAAQQAICNPLLDDGLEGAHGLIISISGGDDLGLMEVDEVANHIKRFVHPEADIIWGSALDPSLAGRIRVSVFATGIDLGTTPSMFAPPPFVSQATASAARIAALRPIDGFVTAAPTREIASSAAGIAPPRPIADFGAAAPQLDFARDAARDEVGEAELALMVERTLVLAPPHDAIEFPTVEPFMLEDGAARRGAGPSRGEGLFERMAILAHGPDRARAIARGLPVQEKERRFA